MFDDIIADMESNKKISPKFTKLFLKGRKRNISLVFISQSYFEVLKTIRLNAKYFIMNIPNKREQYRNSSDIDFKDFMKLYKDYTKETYSFLVNNTTLSSDNPLWFRKNLL